MTMKAHFMAIDMSSDDNSPAGRADALARVEHAAGLCGRDVYAIQSDDDLEGTRFKRGSLAHHWPTDFRRGREHLDQLTERDMLLLMDVDMHLPMESVLGLGLPTMIYTMRIEEVGCVRENHEMTIDELDNVHYTTGSKKYQHRVWNYNVEHLTVPSLIHRGSTVVYNVYQRKHGENHKLVLLEPVAIVRDYVWTLCFWGFPNDDPMLAIKPLSRHKFHVEHVQGRHWSINRYRKTEDGQVQVSVGRSGTYLSATLPLLEFEHLLLCFQTESDKGVLPNRNTTVGFMPGLKPNDPTVSVFRAFIADTPCGEARPLPALPAYYNHTYPDPTGTQPNTAMKPGAVAFMSPLTAKVPIAYPRTLGNEEQAVQGRVKGPQDKVKDVKIRPFMTMCMTELKQRLVPDHLVGAGHPVEAEYVIDAQSTPAKARAMLTVALSAGLSFGARYIKSMLKVEAYLKPTDPRIISPASDQDKFDYAKFIYSWKRNIDPLIPFWGFGLKPEDIEAKLASILAITSRDAEPFVIEGDMTRMDGYKNIVGRQFVEFCFKRYFHVDYHLDLTRVMGQHRARAAKLPCGTSYDTGESMLSGGMDTTLSQSLDSAFMIYYACRLSNMDENSAWDVLCNRVVISGDDSVISGVAPEKFERACASCGHVAKALVRRYPENVSLLARVYSKAAWDGNPSSVYDPARLAKFHMTDRNLTDNQAIDLMVAKCHSFNVNDQNSPLIGIFTSVVLNTAARELGEERLQAALENSKAFWNYNVIANNNGYNNDLDHETASEFALIAAEALQIDIPGLETHILTMFRGNARLDDYRKIDISRFSTEVQMGLNGAIPAGTEGTFTDPNGQHVDVPPAADGTPTQQVPTPEIAAMVQNTLNAPDTTGTAAAPVVLTRCSLCQQNRVQPSHAHYVPCLCSRCFRTKRSTNTPGTSAGRRSSTSSGHRERGTQPPLPAAFPVTAPGNLPPPADGGGTDVLA